MTQTIPNLKLSQILDEIQDGILFKLFGSEYTNVKTLLSTMSQVSNAHSDGYEFELRFINNKGHTSPDLWHSFFNDSLTQQLELIEYDDDVIYSYLPSAPLSGIHFRSYEKSNIYERKTLINSVSSRTEDPTITPLKINLNKESLMSPNKELKRYNNIQRRQRCSYRFKPSLNTHYLNNWRIDKTVRLYAKTLNDKKLSLGLTIDNVSTIQYYDELDIEFEYIGNYSEIQISFFELIKTIYKPYEYFDIEYLIIKHAMNKVLPSQLTNVKNVLNVVPLPMMMTNDILQTVMLKDFMITNKYVGSHGLIVCFGDSPSLFAIYTLTNNELTKIAGDLVLLSIGRVDNSQSTIANIIKSFIENKHDDNLPSLYVFEAMITNKKSYVLTDSLIYNNQLITSKPLIERKQLITDFIDNFKLPFTNASVVKPASWSDILEKRDKSYIVKPLNAPLLESKIYKITFHEQITINFKLQHVPLKRVFYLYTVGTISQVINSKTLNNKYSIDHFGYSLIGGNVSTISPNEPKYLLYVSPYIKESYILRPSATSENQILRDMYSNPLKYNGSIIKMTRADDSCASWVPLSTTDDKEPETYLNALKLESLIFDHLHVSNVSPSKALIPLKPIYSSVYEVLDQYTIERIMLNSRAESILDIINDDNGNISLLYNLSQLKYVYAVSNNKHALTGYIENSTNREFNNRTFIDGTRTRSELNQFSVDVLYSTLNFDSILYELNRKWNYTPSSIDLIYFEDDYGQFTSLIDIINFRRVCEEILSPNGKIILKIFDGAKVNELIEKSNAAVVVANKRKRSRVVNHTLKIDYVDETIFDKDLISRTKSTNKQLMKILNKSKPSADGNTVSYGNNKCATFPNMYNVQNLSHEQLNSLVLIADYYKSHKITMNSDTLNIRGVQLLNLRKILKINTELFANTFTRTCPRYYSEHHEVDKLTGSLGNSSEYVKSGLYINDGLLIVASTLKPDVIEYITSTRLNSNYSTAIITNSDVSISNAVKFVISNEQEQLFMNVIYPNFVSHDDIDKLNKYILRYVIDNNTSDIFKYYQHPKMSNLTYSPRITFYDQFLEFLYEKFKLVDIITPLTQNEIATYIATNRQFSAFDSVEQYLKAYTIITAERL